MFYLARAVLLVAVFLWALTMIDGITTAIDYQLAPIGRQLQRVGR